MWGNTLCAIFGHEKKEKPKSLIVPACRLGKVNGARKATPQKCSVLTPYTKVTDGDIIFVLI